MLKFFKLMEAGLDSLPGAGAEILSDRVRQIVSPAKATSDEWLEVMREGTYTESSYFCHNDVWTYRNCYRRELNI